MTQAKHTPGSLHCRAASSLDNTGGRDYCILDSEGKVIGEAFEHVGFGDDRSTYEKRPAAQNALLWSAAPELLEALKALYQDAIDRSTEVPSRIVDAVVTAIARAEGRR